MVAVGGRTGRTFSSPWYFFLGEISKRAQNILAMDEKMSFWLRQLITWGSLAGGIALAVISSREAQAAGQPIDRGRLAGIIILFLLFLFGLIWGFIERYRAIQQVNRMLGRP